MKYEKAQNILPEEVIKIIQNYIDGTYLYISRKSENKKSWGENSGVLKNLEARNEEIFNRYSSGVSIKELATLYFLSESSIKRIIRISKI